MEAPYGLTSGQVLKNGWTRMVMQKDGNLVISDNDGTPHWAAGVSGQGNYARLQEDGNLVIRDADGDALWASGTFGNPGASLVLQEDGNVVIKSGSTVVWEADTAH